MATVVPKTVGYSRVATEGCIATMLPKSAMAELDQAADEQGLYRSALARRAHALPAGAGREGVAD